MSKLSSLSKGIPSGVILFTHDACILHAIDDHPEQPRRVPGETRLSYCGTYR